MAQGNTFILVELIKDFNAMNIIPGTYTVNLIALDKNEDEVSGTAEVFTVEYGI